MSFKINIGRTDRVVRIIVGLVMVMIAGFAFTNSMSHWLYLGLLGIIPIISGGIGYCPPYSWLGIDTLDSSNVRR